MRKVTPRRVPLFRRHDGKLFYDSYFDLTKIKGRWADGDTAVILTGKNKWVHEHPPGQEKARIWYSTDMVPVQFEEIDFRQAEEWLISHGKDDAVERWMDGDEPGTSMYGQGRDEAVFDLARAGWSYDRIAGLFGVTRERIRQVDSKTISRHRHPQYKDFRTPKSRPEGV